MNQKSRRENNEKGEWKLTFFVREAETDIVLFFDEKESGRVRVEPNRELLERILPAIDTLLVEHKLTLNTLADIHVESDLPDGYSSRRIAETVAGIWKRFHSY